MAKAPKKPVAKTVARPAKTKSASATTVAPAAKAKATKKATPVKKSAGAPAAGTDPYGEQVYRENKAAIDKVLELCAGHLRQLGEPSLALEAVRRLRDYYLKHGAGSTTSGGFKM